MRDYLASEIRNVTILGHAGSGKSSLVEAMLHYTKAIDKLVRIGEHCQTVDFDSEEVKRKQSIYNALAPVLWKECKINFIDSPGYLDFEGEKMAALEVSDNALIVLNAKEGVQSGTIRAYKEVSKRNLPTIFFINKMDEDNVSFEVVYNDLRDKFGKSIIAFEMPIIENDKVVGSINILRKKAWYYNDRKTAKEIPSELSAEVDEYYNQIAEAIAMGSDELMEKFFSGEEFSTEEIALGLRMGVRSGEIRPVYCGSAVNETGIERLLDLISEYFPSYAEKGIISARNSKGEEVKLETNEKEVFSALIFKTIADPFVGRISYLKVSSGVLLSDSMVYNPKKETNEKIGGIYIVKGKNQIAAGKLFTGDIGAVTKLMYSETNDTLCAKDHDIILNEIHFPKPMLGFAIKPKTKADEDKMSNAINKVLEEDKTLKYYNNIETHQQLLYALGDQAIDVVINKLKNKYKVELDLEEPKVQYRETIRAKVEAEGKHKKQSGGAGQYGHVKIRFEPCDSEELIFEEDIFGGSVPKQYFPAVEAGLKECMEKGPLAGYKVVGLKATLYDGSYHEVDSKEIAFKAAARLAFKDGLPKAKPILLEPIAKARVIVLEEYTGTIIGDFNKRRGIILGMELVDNEQIIDAEVPLAEMQKYATELRSMTQGTGGFTLEFDRYEPAPQMVADKVIKNAVKEDE